MNLKHNLLLQFKQLLRRQDHFPPNIVVTAPHGSAKVPWTVFAHLQPAYQTSSRLLHNFSDFGTRYLLEDIPPGQQVIPRYGRLIGDPNRHRQAADIIRLEDFGGMPIFRERFEKRLTTSWLRPLWLKKLLMMSYEPFYQDVFDKIYRLAKDPSNEGLPLFLIDVHDTGNRILGTNWRNDRTRKVGKMPSIVLSNAPDEDLGDGVFGTAPDSLLLDFQETLADRLGIDEKDIELNTVFKGGHMIRYFGNPSQNRHLRQILKGRKLFAIQVEFDRALYLDEVTQQPISWKVRSVRSSFTETLRDLCQGENHEI